LAAAGDGGGVAPRGAGGLMTRYEPDAVVGERPAWTLPVGEQEELAGYLARMTGLSREQALVELRRDAAGDGR